MNLDWRHPAWRFRRRILRAAVLGALPLVLGTGCLLTSGQVLISFPLADISVPTVGAAIRRDIDLNSIADYQDHKDSLKDLVDLALLGQVHNTGGATSVEFWMTPGSTSIATAAGVRSDPTAILVWGPFLLAAGAIQQIGWDASAGLFVGRQALLKEAKGDGVFTLYALASSSATAAVFDVNNGVLVLVLDGGL